MCDWKNERPIYLQKRQIARNELLLRLSNYDCAALPEFLLYLYMSAREECVTGKMKGRYICKSDRSPGTSYSYDCLTTIVPRFRNSSSTYICPRERNV